MIRFILPDIDPAEAVVATVGVREAIIKAAEPVRMSTIHEIGSLPLRIQEAARAFMRGERDKWPRTKVDYRAMFRSLVEENFDLGDMADVAARFPPAEHDAAAVYISKVGSVLLALKQAFPIATYTTYAGTKTNLPPDVAVYRWAVLLQIADDPLCLFDCIGCGGITSKMVQAVRMIYPTVTAAIDSALDQAKARAVDERKSFELPPRAEAGVETWFGRQRFSPNTVAHAQANVQAAMAAKKAPSKGTGTTANRRPAQDLSTAQKAAYMTSADNR